MEDQKNGVDFLLSPYKKKVKHVQEVQAFYFQAHDSQKKTSPVAKFQQKLGFL